MKGIYKLGAVVLALLATITTASAFTEIGDNITVANNVTAQNFLGYLNWAYLLGIPADFPNSTVAGYNGNFPNNTLSGYGNNFPNSTLAGYGSNFPSTSLQNYLLVSTYNGDFPNSTVSTKTTLTQVNSSAQIGESQVTGLTTDLNNKEQTIAGNTSNVFWNGLKQWIGLTSSNISDFTTASRNSIFVGSNLTYSSSTGVINDVRTDYPNSTVANYGGNFPNTSLPNYLLINTYNANFPNSTLEGYFGNFPNASLPNYLLISTYDGNFPNNSLANYLPIATYDGNFPNTTLAGYGNNFPNNSLPNYLLISTYSGNFPNNTVLTKTTLAQVNSSAQIGESQVTNLVTDLSGKEPTIAGSTSYTFWNGLKQFVTLSSGLITDFSAAVRSNISSSSGLVKYNQSTGIFSDTINQSSQISRVQVTGQTGVDDSQNTSIATKTTLTEVNQSANLFNVNANNLTSGTVPNARLPTGTVILLYADEVDTAETTTSTAETTLKNYSLPANSYSTIIVEAEVQARNDRNQAASPTFTWRFETTAATKKTFTWKVLSTATAGVSNRQSATIKTSFVQTGATTLSITGQMGTSNSAIGMLAHSFRVYGVI
jgi:hypothetical protein